MTEVLSVTSKKREIKRSWIFAGVFAIWFALSKIFSGKFTLEIAVPENTTFTSFIGSIAKSIRGNRTESPIFKYFFNPIRQFIDGYVTTIREAISVPSGGSSIPLVGWLGVIALIGFIVYAISNVRTSILAVVLTFGCGALGLWGHSMDTLAMTIASVTLSLAIGIPVGILAGTSDRALKLVTPILDLAQILPTLVYLAPLALFFLIGPASATIATMVYSIPIAIRLTAFGIRGVPKSPVEASVSMGSTSKQTLFKVQLPIAKKTIVLGVNQTVMASLSFVVIAALIGAPGLGKPVIDALIIRNVGEGFVAGFAVVFLAIMLDRSTTAAVVKQNSFVPPSEAAQKRRKFGLAISGIGTVVSIILSRQLAWAAYFPKEVNISDFVANGADKTVHWVTQTFAFFTDALIKFVTVGILNPLEALLSNSPWFLTIAAISVISFLVGGIRSALVTISVSALIVISGLWFDTMITLAQTLVATLLTMVIGVGLGIWVGRSPKADRVIRPIMDAGQVLPAFVYLIPMLGFFGPARFTAIATGIIYSIPVVVKIVGQGIREVPVTMIEAATSAGSTTRQLITKVQLPAIKNSLLLATNQGLIFVLAVVVIGGFVGAGGLGYLVLLGSSKPDLQGKGLTAGFAILLLGIMIDRMAQFAVRKNSAPRH